MNLFQKFIFASCVCTPFIAVAEPQKADSFYEHNYAGRIMSEGNAPARPSRTPTSPTTDKKDSSPQSAVSSSSFFAPGDSPSPSSTTTPPAVETKEELRDKLNPAPVKRIGLIVSGSDDNHFSQSMEKLLDVSLSRKIPVGKVIMVGPFNNPKRKGVFLGIGLQGGKTMGVDEVPAQYPVTKSPTWIVSLEKGDVLLEGFTDIEQFLNAKGEFVEKLRAAS